MKVFNLILFIYFLSVFSVFAENTAQVVESEIKTYRVAVIKDFPPLYMVGISGKPYGFAIDILESIARKKKFNIEYVITENWGSAAELVRNSEVDFVPGYGITASRQKEFLFSAEIENMPVSCFVKKKETRILKIDDLKNPSFKTAVIQNSAAYTELTERGGFFIRQKNNIDDGLNALLAGEVDAFIFPEPVLLKKVQDMGIEDLIAIVDSPLIYLKRGYLFRKTDTKLLEMFNAEISNIVKSQEYSQIYHKWYGTPEHFWTIKKVAFLMLAVFSVLSILFILWKNYSVGVINEKLLRSEENLRITLDSIGDAVISTDTAGFITRMNPIAEKLTGWSLADAVGKPLSEVFRIVNSTTRQVAPNPVEHVLSSGEIVGLANHTALISKSGAEFQIADSGAPIKNASGEVVGVVMVFRDVTEEYNAVTAFKAERERFINVLKGTNVGTWEWNIQTGEILFNDRWAEMLGYKLEELLPTTIVTVDHLLYPDDAKAVNALIEKHFQGELNSFECEVRMKHKNGTWIWVLSKGCVISRAPDGKPLTMYGTQQNINERKLAEKEKEKLQEQLLQSQKMESIGRLAGGVAHDFNNMLSIILGHVDLAMIEKEFSQNSIEQIRSAALRSADLTKQLLTFARKQAIQPKVLNLNSVISNMLDMLRKLIGENIKIEWNPTEDLGSVKIDSTQVEQILANLCINSRDAITRNGNIIIRTANADFDTSSGGKNTSNSLHSGMYVMLSLSDNGCGMDKETLSHLFEPFFTTKELGKGTGLGLSTVYGAVEQNGGFINVYSEPDLGTTFKLYFPRHDISESITSENIPSEKTSSVSGTLLLVEDELVLAQMAEKMLKIGGYNVITTTSAEEALQVIQEHKGKIDIMLTDVVMPGMNGYELYLQVKELYPDIQCLFMSGHTSDVLSRQGIVEEGLNFIQKPFSMKGLIAALGNLHAG
ncbi:MAG: transporter substrate-binding domain-containing protein [Candidatus Riflebacteria bacterium]|nr:transporter substrate-binding domain-containing protein [Candidatus Riflebacteria bacterium]